MSEYNFDKVFFAKDSAGDDIVTVADTVYEIKLPTGVLCRNAMIQVQKATLTDFDPYTDCVPFGWASSSSGPFFLFQEPGKVLGEAKLAGDVLGYIKAGAGHKIVVHTFE